MATSSNSFLKTIRAILYGLVAGFAATDVIVLGWMFLGFLAGWVFSSLGWKQLGYSATVAGLSLVYFTLPIGITVGVIFFYKLSSTRLRQQSAPQKTNSC